MRQGDLVTRKSYGGDILFRIEQIIFSEKAVLRGVDYRLMADAPVQDLERANSSSSSDYPRLNEPTVLETMRRMGQFRKQQHSRNQSVISQKNAAHSHFFEMPGKVLHLDGDPFYLKKSLHLYNKLRVPAEGFYVNEKQMPDVLYRLLPRIKPDIVVITGHDGLIKNRRKDLNSLESYKNSLYFVKAVQIARQYERSRDNLTIVAGACQSHFEALLHAGANFASSPARILIHALDPLCIASKLACTSIRDTISMIDMAELTVTGLEGLGGLESRGSYRLGVPRLKAYEKESVP
ncbi:sporulation peptidase YabG [Paenibacillus larvae]